MRSLRRDETLAASTLVHADPEVVHAIVADVRRFHEWSPETVRTEWTGPGRFASWNRRRLALWRTSARVVVDEPGREFGFVVELPGGGDWTEWRYRTQPGPDAGTTHLSQSFRMCRNLPLIARLYELAFLFVYDRRRDLQKNLESGVGRIRVVAEREGRSRTDGR